MLGVLVAGVSGLHRARDDANGVVLIIPESGGRPVVCSRWSNSIGIRTMSCSGLKPLPNAPSPWELAQGEDWRLGGLVEWISPAPLSIGKACPSAGNMPLSLYSGWAANYDIRTKH